MPSVQPWMNDARVVHDARSLNSNFSYVGEEKFHRLLDLAHQSLAAEIALLENFQHMPLEPMAVIRRQLLGADDDDRNFAPVLVFSQLGNHLEAIHHRHS